MTSISVVSIVGAGPGDPELLTCRALARLRAADIVLHDGLVPRAIVRLARSARHQPVSRRAGTDGPSPAAVAASMIVAARRGDRVVRLKAGDPFVLARGAEEALALVAAGVPFEIVPGLTSASAAPTLAGIPLTHRGVSSGVIVVSGHAATAWETVLESLPPHAVTVVVLMGLAERGRMATRLIARGWRPDTPAAIVTSASQPGQRVWRRTLQALSADTPLRRHTAPGVIVIGDVVDVGAALTAGSDAPASFGRMTWQL